jgi:hypothetical protein
MTRVITPLRQTQHHPRDWAESTAGNHITNNDLGVFVLQGDNSSECVTPAPTLTAEQIVANLITKDDGLTNTETDQYGNAYAGSGTREARRDDEPTPSDAHTTVSPIPPGTPEQQP